MLLLDLLATHVHSILYAPRSKNEGTAVASVAFMKGSSGRV
jgi:hypothetical protein